MPKSPSTNIINLLHEGVKQFGLKKVEQKLKELYDISTGRRQELLKKKICEEVSASYGYSVKVIFHSTRRGSITQAKALLMILLHHHLNLSQTEIAKMFGPNGKNPSLVSRRIKAFNAYMGKSGTLYENEKDFEKIYSDKDFRHKFETINSRINEFKQSWKRN